MQSLPKRSEPIYRVRAWIDYLSGQWHLARQIDDHLTGQQGTLTGTASFTGNDPANLHWHEQGTLSIGTYEGEAWRDYRVVQADDGMTRITFDDGRPFFELPNNLGRTDIDHSCPPDRYTGTIDILSENQWRLDWTIRGPRKNLTIGTVYTREQ